MIFRVASAGGGNGGGGGRGCVVVSRSQMDPIE